METILFWNFKISKNILFKDNVSLAVNRLDRLSISDIQGGKISLPSIEIEVRISETERKLN